MLNTEYVRSLNCNFERLPLDNKPDENRYQYCILSRGGINGLLSCSLRYINDQAYLYYDISSKQNVFQLYTGRTLDRNWMRDFLWGMQQVKLELGRFLLDDRNVIWHSEHIFQDLEKNDFYFLYIPYYEDDCGFLNLVEFWVEHIDYEDEALVEFVYKTHEQYELLGSVYLLEQIFEDSAMLEQPKILTLPQKEIFMAAEDRKGYQAENNQIPNAEMDEKQDIQQAQKYNKKGLRYLLEGRKKKQKEERSDYQKQIQQALNGCKGEVDKEVRDREDEKETEEKETEEFGKTIYIEESDNGEKKAHRLFTKDNRLLSDINKTPFIIGKKADEADCCLNDASVSRIHARIIEEEGKYYLEDLNATNGTYKNGLRMQPYEKRILEAEDEVKLGKVCLIFR